jgi:DNA-directed RNA polymerase alpha subunit
MANDDGKWNPESLFWQTEVRISYEGECRSVDLNQGVKVLGLSTRAINILWDNGIETLCDLVVKSDKDLVMFRDCGPVTRWEINEKLKRIGLKLRGNRGPVV